MDSLAKALIEIANKEDDIKAHLSRDNIIPLIIVSAAVLKSLARMMIDIEIKTNEVLRRTEVNVLPVYTLGQIEIALLGFLNILNIIIDDVPVDKD